MPVNTVTQRDTFITLVFPTAKHVQIRKPAILNAIFPVDHERRTEQLNQAAMRMICICDMSYSSYFS